MEMFSHEFFLSLHDTANVDAQCGLSLVVKNMYWVTYSITSKRYAIFVLTGFCFFFLRLIFFVSDYEDAKSHVDSFQRAERPIVLIGTKLDLEDQREVSRSEALDFAMKHGVGWIEVSRYESRRRNENRRRKDEGGEMKQG